MKFIGIDLAWTYKNETGICILDSDGHVEYMDAQIYTNEEIIELIKVHRNEHLTIAIDAPLIVNNAGGSRGAEGEMMRAKINGHRLRAFNANRNYFNKVFGGIRGEALMHMIQEEFPDMQTGFSRTASSIVETFPTGIVAGLFPEIAPVKYKRKPKMTHEETVSEMGRLLAGFEKLETGEELVSKLESSPGTEGVTKRELKHLEDKVDALLCAYAMFALHKEVATAQTFGTIDKGFITIPVRGPGSERPSSGMN
ncbi:DUF429 domain-containing protein [Lacicoccus alkaliphilus]|uniref:Predicted nuclease (RNAse H fold) n=1 Tax=Lacicoccus alkaliphilus DSM 16010 TaxID=1123231 RepID=A0A1M7JBZ1_9BACL|nr:DUF429 domain-containing protein [Salinicoccus alkaliphilus]SHM50494.1 Predicted nuclease (RNAse H fold) [Salinicoccus alkaliphilus DSM 16010]